MQFSKYLKLCREESSMTQKQLVDDLYNHDIENFSGLDTNTLGKWERGTTQPKALKQLSIFKYFQELTNMALPYLHSYSEIDAQDLICKIEIKNLFGNSKQLIYNFPSEMMSPEDIKVYLVRNSDRMDSIIESSVHFQQNDLHDYIDLSYDKTRELALHPHPLFLACAYKNNILGWLFCIKLKHDVFEKIMNFEMKKNDIQIEDIVGPDEEGSVLMGSYFSMNTKAASMLLLRYYAYLIAYQNTIIESGGSTTVEEARKLFLNMNLKKYSSYKKEGLQIKSYRQSLKNIFASQTSMQILFSKNSCSEN